MPVKSWRTIDNFSFFSILCYSSFFLSFFLLCSFSAFLPVFFVSFFIPCFIFLFFISLLLFSSFFHPFFYYTFALALVLYFCPFLPLTLRRSLVTTAGNSTPNLSFPFFLSFFFSFLFWQWRKISWLPSCCQVASVSRAEMQTSSGQPKQTSWAAVRSATLSITATRVDRSATFSITATGVDPVGPTWRPSGGKRRKKVHPKDRGPG